MTNYSISVDWLQVYCLKKANTLFEPMFQVRTILNNYVINLSAQSTAMFDELYTVCVYNIEVAYIECKPRSSKLNKDMVLIKLANRVLYSHKYIEMLYDLIAALKLTYKGITRIDVCYDCNEFKDHRSVSKFINVYVLRSASEKGGISRVGSDEFIVHGKKQSGSTSKINYIAFGSPKSRIRCYMYDKTIELNEVHDKPWIRETWEKNNLVSNEEKHVYRCEISIKSEGTDLINMSTGELFRVSPEYLKNQEVIERLFYVYAKKSFNFRVCGGQKAKKNYTPIHLFESMGEITTKPIQISSCADTGRMEQICINKLHRLSETYTDLAEQKRKGLIVAIEFLNELRGMKESKVSSEKQLMYIDSLKGRKFYDEEFYDMIRSSIAKEAAEESLRSSFQQNIYGI